MNTVRSLKGITVESLANKKYSEPKHIIKYKYNK